MIMELNETVEINLFMEQKYFAGTLVWNHSKPKPFL